MTMPAFDVRVHKPCLCPSTLCTLPNPTLPRSNHNAPLVRRAFVLCPPYRRSAPPLRSHSPRPLRLQVVEYHFDTLGKNNDKLTRNLESAAKAVVPKMSDGDDPALTDDSSLATTDALVDAALLATLKSSLASVDKRLRQLRSIGGEICVMAREMSDTTERDRLADEVAEKGAALVEAQLLRGTMQSKLDELARAVAEGTLRLENAREDLARVVKDYQGRMEQMARAGAAVKEAKDKAVKEARECAARELKAVEALNVVTARVSELEEEIKELVKSAKDAAVAAKQHEKKAVASAVEKTREQCKKQAGT